MESSTTSQLPLAPCYESLNLLENFLENLRFSHLATAMPSVILITTDTPTCFDSLPRELRDKIWQYALPNPRIVKADVVDGLWKQTFDYDHEIDNPRYFYRIPNLLHICRESREIALKFYQPLLTDPVGHPMFLFDPENDVLSVGKSRYNGPRVGSPVSHFGNPTNIINGSMVQRLAITQRDMKFEVMIHRKSLDEFPNITELFFFQSEPCPPKKLLAGPTADLTEYFELKDARDAGEYANRAAKKAPNKCAARKEVETSPAVAPLGPTGEFPVFIRGWASWRWTIHQINRLGEGLASTKHDLEVAWNMSANYEILPGPLVFRKSEDGINKYLGLKKLRYD